MFPQVVYETHRYRVVARLVECKTVPDSIRFSVEGACCDSMGKLAWSVDQVSQRSRMEVLEEALEAFVAAKAEEATHKLCAPKSPEEIFRDLVSRKQGERSVADVEQVVR